MMPIDPHFKSWKRLRGRTQQIEKASGSGTEVQVQVSVHHTKLYVTEKVYENERSAEDWYYNKAVVKPRGKKRLIKIENKVMTVLREHMGEFVESDKAKRLERKRVSK